MTTTVGRRLSGVMWPFVVRSLVVVGVAVSARLFFVIWSAFWAGDSDAYERIALNVLAGNGYAIHPDSPTVFRPPGYPLFIASIYAALGAFPGYVLLMQAFLGGLASWCLYLLGRRLLSDQVSFAGALLAAAYPHLAWYSATLLSETLAFAILAPTMLGITYLSRERMNGWLATGIGVGSALTALTTPRFALLPLGLMAVLLVRQVGVRQIIRTMAFVSLGYFVTLAPWVARNQIVFGVPVPFVVGMQGLVFWLPTYRVGLYEYRFQLWAETEPLMARWVRLYTGGGIARERDELEERIRLEGDLFADAGRRIAADPIGFLGHQARLVPALWIQPAAYAGHFRPPFEAQNDRLEAMLAKGHVGSAIARSASTLLFTGGLFGGALLGIFALRRRRSELALLLMPALYVVALQTFAYIEHRFSILAHPFLWLVAVAGWYWVVDLMRARRRAS